MMLKDNNSVVRRLFVCFPLSSYSKFIVMGVVAEIAVLVVVVVVVRISDYFLLLTLSSHNQ